MCFVYASFHQSIVIQDNSIGVFFNAVLAEFPAILHSLFTSTTSDYMRMVGRGGGGGWGATKWHRKHTLYIMDPLVLEMA